MASNKKIENRLELDKLEIDASTDQTPIDETTIPSEETEEVKWKKILSLLWAKKLFVLPAFLILVSIFVVLFLWTKGIIFSPKQIEQPKGFYSSIGPMTIAMGDVGKITLSLDVHFIDNTFEGNIANINRLIKFRILNFLSSETAIQIITGNNLIELKAALKTEINIALKGNYVDKIYFSKAIIH